MKISIFTPTHNARFLEESYRAICEQEIREGDDWEWIVLLNNGAKFEPRDRVKIVHDDTGIQEFIDHSWYEYDGGVVDELPASLEIFTRCRPIYEEMPGWREDIQGVKKCPSFR